MPTTDLLVRIKGDASSLTVESKKAQQSFKGLQGLLAELGVIAGRTSGAVGGLRSSTTSLQLSLKSAAAALTRMNIAAAQTTGLTKMSAAFSSLALSHQKVAFLANPRAQAAAFGQLSGSMGRMATQAAGLRAFVPIANTMQLMGVNAARAAPKVTTLTSATNLLNSGLGKTIISLTAFASVAAGIQFVSRAIKAFAEAEGAFRPVLTLAKFSQKEIEGMRESTEHLRREFGLTAKAVGGARFDVISSGFKDIAAQDEILRSGFQLSLTATADYTNAVKILTQTMAALGLDASHTAEVMDQLKAIADNSKNTLEELGPAIAVAAPSAKATGKSLVELGASLDVLTLAGIDASQAGTMLSSTFIQLIKPETLKRLKEANIGLDFAKIQSMDLVDVIRELPIDQADKLFEILGRQEAFRGISTLGSNLDVLKKKLDKVAKSAGLVEGELKEAMDDADLRVNRLSASWTILQEKVGKNFFSSSFIENLASTFDIIADNFEHIRNAAGATKDLMTGDFLAFFLTIREEAKLTAEELEKGQKPLGLMEQVLKTEAELAHLQKRVELGFGGVEAFGPGSLTTLEAVQEKTRELVDLERQLAEAGSNVAGGLVEQRLAADAAADAALRRKDADPEVPDPVQTKEQAEAVEKLIAKARQDVAAQSAEGLIEQERVKWQGIIAEAEKGVATANQLEELRSLRATALNRARIEEQRKSDKAISDVRIATIRDEFSKQRALAITANQKEVEDFKGTEEQKRQFAELKREELRQKLEEIASQESQAREDKALDTIAKIRDAENLSLAERREALIAHHEFLQEQGIATVELTEQTNEAIREINEEQNAALLEGIETVAQGTQNAMSNALVSMMDGTASFAEAMKAMWQGIRQAIFKAIADMIAEFIVGMIKNLIISQVTSKGKIIAARQVGMANAIAAHAGIPFIGLALGLAAAAQVGAAISALAVFAEGGIVTGPTLGLVGEAGPEAIIPLNRLGGMAGGSDEVSEEIAPSVTNTFSFESLSPEGSEQAVRNTIMPFLEEMQADGGTTL